MNSEKSPPLARIRGKIQQIKAAHQARHTPTGYEIAIADRIDQLNPVLWDAAAVAGGFHLRRSYLRVLEEHGPENLCPVYALITEDGKPIAAVAAQWLEFDGKRVARLSAEESSAGGKRVIVKEKLLKPVGRKMRQHLRQRVLVCGNVLSWGHHGVSFAAGVSDAWPAVGEALYRMRRAAKLDGQTDFVVIKDQTPAQADCFPQLKALGYRCLDTEPNMVLALDPGWMGIDDYEAALAAKYRKSAKQIRDGVSKAGFVVERLTEIGKHASRIHELYQEVHHNAPVRLATLPEEFWAAFSGCAGGDLRCSIIRRGNEIVGFVNTVRDGDTAIGYQIGFDRMAATEASIYLRLLQATIDDAIAFGCQRLSLGRTALEPKARLGAKPETMQIWLRHRIPAINWLVKGIVGHVPHADPPERNPFK